MKAEQMLHLRRIHRQALSELVKRRCIMIALATIGARRFFGSDSLRSMIQQRMARIACLAGPSAHIQREQSIIGTSKLKADVKLRHEALSLAITTISYSN